MSVVYRMHSFTMEYAVQLVSADVYSY